MSFSGAMVRALLDGRKTQTRRPVTFQNSTVDGNGVRKLWDALDWRDVICNGDHFSVAHKTDGSRHRVRPRIEVGDLLRVRETWLPEFDLDTMQPTGRFLYQATHEGEVAKFDGDGYCLYRKDGTLASPWRSPMFMPRAASRITMEVTRARGERLQDISTKDIIAEGSETDEWLEFDDWQHSVGFGCECKFKTLTDAFRELWDSIYSAKPGRDWESNPLVWAYDFKVMTP